jgi:hypothetical protein
MEKSVGHPACGLLQAAALLVVGAVKERLAAARAWRAVSSR